MMKRDVNDEVRARLGTSGSMVFDRAVDALVEQEIAARAQLVTTAAARLAQLRRDLTKVRPDLVTYNADGKPVSTGFSKARVDEKQKLEKSIERLEEAFDRALADAPDYDPLRRAVAEKAPGGKDDAAAAS